MRLNKSESTVLFRLLAMIALRHDMSADRAKKKGELAKMEVHTAILEWAQLIGDRAEEENSVSIDEIPRLACELREQKRENLKILKAGKSGRIELGSWEIEELEEDAALCRRWAKKCRQNMYGA